MTVRCRLHENCVQPCPIEAAVHLEIQAMVSDLTPHAKAAQRRNGQRGGHHSNPGRFIGKGNPAFGRIGPAPRSR